MQHSVDETTRSKRQEFYDRLKPHDLAPLWEVMKGMLPPEPSSKALPHRWRYQDIRPLVIESGSLLTAEEAERRVLVLENPAFPGQSRATSTLYAGIQVIMPGETAPAHRHTPSALRFMLEGEGAYTAVGGERTKMSFGDFVITPAWAYHDHGNEGSDPAVWLDGLDVPMIAFFEAVFREDYNDDRQEIMRPEGDSLARFGSGLLPLSGGSRYGLTTPIFNYPYERTREALYKASRGEAVDPHLGTTLRYANPMDGGWTMPTMSAWVTLIPRDMETARIRSTDGIIMCIAEGSGTITVGDKVLDFSPRDVIAVPGWKWRSFKASEDCVVFCFSDRVAQEKLGYFCEDRARP
ncbi:gentisate 1,2-dioxygenase [Chelativorans sp.]|uniref:gentisate 1,2-dioxygenase n=1 Tax=Chelativorans sp. TaxID=2203393 RepID=UPI002811FF83|nr:gentisate 1,2-dioxygenase [Chelativorans sp.]